MRRIECPLNGTSPEDCNWESIPGRVRDTIGIGVQQCMTCALVTHEVDLSEHVNYESGSMHDWASGYGDQLTGPSSDNDRRVERVTRQRQGAVSCRILDFGCGDGTFLKSLDDSWEKYGLEPDTDARKLANAHGLIFDSAESALEVNLNLDVVTLFHVVEHFYKPSIEFEAIYKILRPGGLVIIETPNSQDALLTKYQNSAFREFTYWSHHPMLHSKKSLENLLTLAGFNIVESLGIQRYGLANHLNWLANGTPGGHIKWESWISQETENNYEADLCAQNASDTLWIVASKPYSS